jgi:hypothetical protein
MHLNQSTTNSKKCSSAKEDWDHPSGTSWMQLFSYALWLHPFHVRIDKEQRLGSEPAYENYLWRMGTHDPSH